MTVGGAHFEEVVDLFFGGNAFRIVYIALGSGDREHFRSHFKSLLADTPRYIAESGQRDGLSLDVRTFMLENLIQVVHGTIPCSLRTDFGTAVGHAFTCQNTVFPRTL